MSIYKLVIIIDQPQVEISLYSNQKVIDSMVWNDTNDLSVTLLLQIDQLLTGHNLNVWELEKVEVVAQEASFTSARIAQAVAKTINYGLKTERNKLDK